MKPFFFNGGKRENLLRLVSWSVVWETVGPCSVNYYIIICSPIRKQHITLNESHFTLSFFVLPEINKVALNLALLFSNHSSSLTRERKYKYILLYRAITL